VIQIDVRPARPSADPTKELTMKLAIATLDGGEEVWNTEVITDPDLEVAPLGPPVFDEGVEVEAGADEICTKVKIASLKGVPEFKSDMCMTKVGFIKTKLPCVLTRTSNKVIYASLCYPKVHEKELADAARDCAIGAAGAATVTSFIATPAAALPAFKAAFMACLKVKAGTLASKVKVGLHSESEHGSWKRRV
jgi:hypothetical protein